MFHTNLDPKSAQTLANQITLGTLEKDLNPVVLYYSNMVVIQKGVNPWLTVDKKDGTESLFLKRIGTNRSKMPIENHILVTCKGCNFGKINGNIQVPEVHYDFFNNLLKGEGYHGLTKNHGKWYTILLSIPQNFNTIIKINYSGIINRYEYIVIYNNNTFTITSEQWQLFTSMQITKNNVFNSLFDEDNWITL